MYDEREPVDLRCSVLFFRDNHVLLCRRVDLRGIWVLPGGTPRPGEATAAAARREVEEETGIQISPERVAFVLETSSWDKTRHVIEVVFLGSDRDRTAAPVQREENLEPSLVPLDTLDRIELRPPIAGYIRGFSRAGRPTAAYLGNVWRPHIDGQEEAGSQGGSNGPTHTASAPRTGGSALEDA